MLIRRHIVVLAAGAALLTATLSGCVPTVFLPSHPGARERPRPAPASPPGWTEQTVGESCDILAPAVSAFITDLPDFSSDLENDPLSAASSFELVTDKVDDAVSLVTNHEVRPVALELSQATDTVNGDLFVAAVYKEPLDEAAFLDHVATFQTAALALVTVCNPGGVAES